MAAEQLTWCTLFVYLLLRRTFWSPLGTEYNFRKFKRFSSFLFQKCFYSSKRTKTKNKNLKFSFDSSQDEVGAIWMPSPYYFENRNGHIPKWLIIHGKLHLSTTYDSENNFAFKRICRVLLLEIENITCHSRL